MQFSDVETLNETSNDGPSALVFKGSRFIAWRGTDDQVNVLQLKPDGGEGSKLTGQKTHAEPELFTDGQTLFICWQGTDQHLNIARIQM
jgi:hypothetical protein